MFSFEHNPANLKAYISELVGYKVGRVDPYYNAFYQECINGAGGVNTYNSTFSFGTKNSAFFVGRIFSSVYQSNPSNFGEATGKGQWSTEAYLTQSGVDKFSANINRGYENRVSGAAFVGSSHFIDSVFCNVIKMQVVLSAVIPTIVFRNAITMDGFLVRFKNPVFRASVDSNFIEFF